MRHILCHRFGVRICATFVLVRALIFILVRVTLFCIVCVTFVRALITLFCIVCAFARGMALVSPPRRSSEAAYVALDLTACGLGRHTVSVEITDLESGEKAVKEASFVVAD